MVRKLSVIGAIIAFPCAIAANSFALQVDGDVYICPADACWVPTHYENQLRSTNPISEGLCVTITSYRERCTEVVQGNAGTSHGCYFCVNKSDGDGVGNTAGACTEMGTSLGLPPAGMVYPGVSGYLPQGFDKAQLETKLCDGFHRCRCGDDGCSSAPAAAHCADLVGGTQGTKEEQVCCTRTSGAPSTLVSTVFLVIVVPFLG